MILAKAPNEPIRPKSIYFSVKLVLWIMQLFFSSSKIGRLKIYTHITSNFHKKLAFHFCDWAKPVSLSIVLKRANVSNTNKKNYRRFGKKLDG